MKNLTVPVLALIIVCSSCQKTVTTTPEENTAITSSQGKETAKARYYRDSFTTQYQFVPGAGWEFPNPGPGYYPGKGIGYASHIIGTATTYFNSYVEGPPFFHSGPSSVNLFFRRKLESYGVPDAANSVVVDEKGNSIWFAATSLVQFPVSDTRINFEGTADIIGGSGKFSNASGSVTLNGYFNPIDPTDAGIGSKGTIVY